MTSVEEATERLTRAIEQLERVAGKSPAGGGKADDAMLARTASQVAARLDAAIGRIDRLLEE